MTMPAEPPAIADSLDAFVSTMPSAPTAPAAPATPPVVPAATTEPAAPVAPAGDDLDLTGAIEQASAPTAPAAPAATEPEDKIFEGGPKALREQYAKVKSELGTLRAELTAIKSKSQTDQTPAELAAAKKEAETLKQRVKAIETERDNFAKDLAKIDITRSPEFIERYQTPWRQAQDAAASVLAEYTKENESGEKVPVEWEDFKPLLTMKTPAAVEKAKELLGDHWQIAMTHRERLLEHRNNYAKAVEQHEAQVQNIETERAKAKEAMDTAFASETSRLETDYPTLYKPDDKNASEVELHSKAEQLARAALFGKEGMKPETRIRAGAIAFKRAAMMPIIAGRLKTATDRIAALEAELAEARGNGPGGGISKTGDAGPVDDIGSSMDNFVKSSPKAY